LIELVHPVLKDRAIALPVDDNIYWAGRVDEGNIFSRRINYRRGVLK